MDTSNENKEEKIDKFEAKSVYEMFYNVLKYSNYEVFKFYKLTFAKKALTNNLGSIVTLIFFVLYLACFIFFIIKGITPLKNKLGEIIPEDKKINFLFFPPIKNRKSAYIKSQNKNPDKENKKMKIKKIMKIKK